VSGTEAVVVFCTVPAAEARALVDSLLDERWIACANILGPFKSRYLWKGKIEESEEMLLLMKSRGDLALGLRRRIQELHSYEVPEVLEVEVRGGLQAYIDWVVESCGPRNSAPPES
jgi:periplasmic divalent cation tolerance protein